MFKYRLLFNPQPLPGFTAEQVREHVRQLLKLTDAQLHALYATPGKVLKKDLDKEKAEAYQKQLARYGIQVIREIQLELEPGPDDEPAGLPQPAAGQQPESGSPFRLEPVEGHSRPATAATQPQKPGGALGSALPAGERLNPSAPRRVPMEFTGTGGEYFGIWIINVVLTILTLGIYSAWAKVRTRKYFYGHSILDGNGFQYLANPLTILKGRIIAFAALVIWQLTSNFMPLVSFLLLLLFIPVLPWVLSRSLRFNAINTSYRGVRFNFVGDYWGAAKVVLLWPFVSAITFSLGLPLSLHQKHKYQVENSRYGLAAFHFKGQLTDYYLFGLKVLLTILVAGFLFVTVHPVAALLGYLLVFGYFQATLTNLYMNNVGLAGHQIESNMGKRATLWIYFTNSLLIGLTAGLFTPWAKVRMARYRASCTTIVLAGDLDKFVGQQADQVSALGQELGDMFDMDFALI